jgi:hypothetical protein
MGIRWTASSAKHGVRREDAVHAMLHPVYRVSPYGDARVDGLGAPDLWIGPGQDGEMLEVMAAVEPTTRTLWVFHVMPARPKTITEAKGMS